jgi:alpha-aminoadipate carrier protein LysW
LTVPRFYINASDVQLVWEVPAVVRCPKCAVEIDVDEDEVEEGEILNCPECLAELEVVQIHPVSVNVISDDEDEDDDEDDEEDDDDEDDAEDPVDEVPDDDEADDIK